jgi:hypothetical protein
MTRGKGMTLVRHMTREKGMTRGKQAAPRQVRACRKQCDRMRT